MIIIKFILDLAGIKLLFLLYIQLCATVVIAVQAMNSQYFSKVVDPGVLHFKVVQIFGHHWKLAR